MNDRLWWYGLESRCSDPARISQRSLWSTTGF
jgi:hypothetical protein